MDEKEYIYKTFRLYLIFFLIVLVSCEQKKEKDAVTLIQDRIQNVINQSYPSIVTIFSKREKGNLSFKDFDDESVGSGFVVKVTSNYLYIATNAHVIEKYNSVYVKFYNDRIMKGEVVGIDEKTDIAVIKVKLSHINNDIKALKFERKDNIKPGMFVLAAGSPYNLGHSYSFGIISAVDRDLGITPIEGYIQTDAAINPGDSGGPLLNLYGKVVGMNIATVQTGQGLGFAISVEILEDVVNQLIKHGKVSRGWIGVTVADLSEEVREKMNIDDGVIVLKIEKNSPASNTGLMVGDIITKVNKIQVRNTREFKKIINSVKPDEMLELEVLNVKGKRTITIIAVEKNKDGGV